MPKLTIDGREVEVADGHQPRSRPRAPPGSTSRTSATTPTCRSSASAGSAWSRSRGSRAWRSPARPPARDGMVVHVGDLRAGQGGARGGHGVPARQPPARLPGLRPGRRVPPAGPLVSSSGPRHHPHGRDAADLPGPRAAADRAARDPEPEPLHPLLALHPLHPGDLRDRRAHLQVAGQPRLHRHLRRRALRQPVVRRAPPTSARWAPSPSRSSASASGSGSSSDAVGLPRLLDRLQHLDRPPRPGGRLPLHAPREPRGQRLRGCATTAASSPRARTSSDVTRPAAAQRCRAAAGGLERGDPRRLAELLRSTPPARVVASANLSQRGALPGRDAVRRPPQGRGRGAGRARRAAPDQERQPASGSTSVDAHPNSARRPAARPAAGRRAPGSQRFLCGGGGPLLILDARAHPWLASDEAAAAVAGRAVAVASPAARPSLDPCRHARCCRPPRWVEAEGTLHLVDRTRPARSSRPSRRRARCPGPRGGCLHALGTELGASAELA